MRKDFDSVEASYISHSASYEGYADGEKNNAIAQTWLKNNTVNALRCKQMYQLIDPFIKTFPKAKWLTVGDGRYGSDAIYIKNQGADVVASDLCDKLLIESQAMGYIDAYRKENAEALSFDDNTFDFVYCKEAYHHFPRPSLALYEMLRVAKRGVVLLEPIDRVILPWYQQIILNGKDLIKKCLQKPVARDFFEEEGNYLYSVSRREFEKLALGLGLHHIVFKGINDIYLAGLEFAKPNPSDLLYKKWRRKQKLYDSLSRLGLLPYNLLFTMICKTDLEGTTITTLQQEKYDIMTLPQNPYLKTRIKSL